MCKFLSALVDFPDDAGDVYDKKSLDALLKKLHETGVKRVYWQWYGDHSDGYFWRNSAACPEYEGVKKTAGNLPEMNRSFTEAAKRYGIETVCVMRPLETGIWRVFSPWYPYDGEPSGILHTGGDIRIATDFLLKHPQLRVKSNWKNGLPKKCQ